MTKEEALALVRPILENDARQCYHDDTIAYACSERAGQPDWPATPAVTITYRQLREAVGVLYGVKFPE